MAEVRNVLLKIEVDDVSQAKAKKRLEELNGELAENRAERDRLNKKIKENARELKKLNEAEDKNVDKILELTKSQREYKKELTKTKTAISKASAEERLLTKVHNAEKGSLAALRAETALLSKKRRENTRRTKEERAEYKRLTQQIKINKAELAKANRAVGGFFDNVGNYAGGVSRALANAAIGLTSFLGLQQLVSRFVTVVKDVGEAEANVRKTTGLLAGDVKDLREQLQGIKTRSSVTELLELAEAAGRVGVGRDLIEAGDIEGAKKLLFDYAKTADRIFVALNDELDGSAEEIARTIGKISATLGAEETFGTAEGINRIGSAINALSQNTKATAQPIIDGARRLQGLAQAAGIGAGDILGLTATVDDLGLQTEESSGAIQKFTTSIAKDIPVFAKIAGKSLEDFSRIAEEDANEALLLVLEGATKTRGGLQGLNQVLEKLGISSVREGRAITALAANVDVLRANQKLANEELQTGQSIADEYAIKNDTLAASIDRLGNTFDKILLGEGGGGLKSFVEFLERALVGLDNYALGVKKFFVGLKNLTEEEILQVLKVGFTEDGRSVWDELLAPLNEQSDAEFRARINQNKKLFFDLLKEEGGSLEEIRAAWDVYNKTRQKSLFDDSGALAQTYKPISEDVNELTDKQKALIDQFASAKGVTAEYTEEMLKLAQAWKSAAGGGGGGGALSALNKELATLTKEFENLILGGVTSGAQLEAVVEKINRINGAILNLKSTSDALLSGEITKAPSITDVQVTSTTSGDDQGLVNFDFEAYKAKFKEGLEELGSLEEEALLDGAQMLAQQLGTLDSLFSNFNQNRIEEIEAQTEAALAGLEEQYERGVIGTQQYEEQRKQIEKDGEDRRKRAQKAEAQRTKDLAIFKATLELILALASLNPLRIAGATVALGAAIAEPIPTFAEGGDLSVGPGEVPASGGMIKGKSHARGGVKFRMPSGKIGEADGAKGEAYIVNVGRDPMLKALASALNVEGGGRPFAGVAPSGFKFAEGGEVNFGGQTSGIVDAINRAATPELTVVTDIRDVVRELDRYQATQVEAAL